MESPRRRKRYFGFRLQPRRLLKRDNLAEWFCLQVGGFEMFKQFACISTLGCDISLVITYDEIKAIERDSQGNMYELFFTQGNVFENLSACKSHHYIIIKICVPGHVSLALWDTISKEIELFDSGGMHSMIQLTVLALRQAISMLDLGDTLKDIRIVNQKYLQVLPEDTYCQTWIYFYLYLRFYLNYSSEDINDYFVDLLPAEKLKLIEDFRNIVLSFV